MSETTVNPFPLQGRNRDSSPTGKYKFFSDSNGMCLLCLDLEGLGLIETTKGSYTKKEDRKKDRKKEGRENVSSLW